MKRFVAAAAAFLGVFTTSMVAAPVFAGTNATSVNYVPGDADCPDNLRSRARFFYTNDVVQSVDDCVDGWGAESELLLSNGTYRSCYNGGGNGTTKSCDYAFAPNLVGELLARSFDNGNFREAGNVVVFLS